TYYASLSTNLQNNYVSQIFSMQKSVLTPLYTTNTNLFYDMLRINSGYQSDIDDAINDRSTALGLLDTYFEEIYENHIGPQEDNPDLSELLLRVNAILMVSNLKNG